MSGALGSVVRDARRGTLSAERLAAFFPAIHERIAEYRAHPERLTPQEDLIRLSALQDVLLSGEAETDVDFVVKATAALSVAKSSATRAKAALDAP